MSTTVSLCDIATVELTEDGIQQCYDHFRASQWNDAWITERLARAETKDGRYEFQLGELMGIFGEQTHLGNPKPVFVDCQIEVTPLMG